MRKTILFVSILLGVACGGGSPPAEEPVSSEEPSTSVSSPEPGAGRPATPGPDGTPENCPFIHADLCYDTSEQACAAAGCAADACRIMESYPAQVACD